MAADASSNGDAVRRIGKGEIDACQQERVAHGDDAGGVLCGLNPGDLGDSQHIALFHAAALDEGCGTVGTRLELEHSAPTPVGMTVTCESELVAVEGRKLTFKVALHDEKGPVGGGTHERFVVNDAKFAAKAEAKKG